MWNCTVSTARRFHASLSEHFVHRDPRLSDQPVYECRWRGHLGARRAAGIAVERGVEAQIVTGLPAVLAAERSPSVTPCLGVVVTDLVTKKLSRLQVVRRGDLRVRVSSIEPNIDKLVRSHLREPNSSG
ncbi:hypothetical protein M514_09408 [Trichuris suis]|uniref:Uncharacterized protein n=1 Tax=Trichuris suis TaxID=68888 RepID=A0A085LXL5_9BILA|nr:hypothetical protein M513_09408 [Trichuris suis]KFD62068.1 hypothetical protein M514_09408 [Trichuris suis]